MSVQYKLNKELAQMLKGGVIMDVTAPEQAKIAEAAGACAVMALERIPADIRAAGGVSRMSDPKMIKEIQEAVSIPVMAKCRIGHFVEAQILEAIEIDYIDESEVLSPADDVYHIDKKQFKVPFVCGAKDLGEALRRINEGASMIRTKGEPGTGDVVQAVRHMRMMNREIARITSMRQDELFEVAKELRVPYELVLKVHDTGRLPVVNFAAGGVATPADAALMMQLGAEGVFVGSGIFKSGNPAKRAASIVKAVTNYTDAKRIAELSADLGEAMVGINEQEIAFRSECTPIADGSTWYKLTELKSCLASDHQTLGDDAHLTDDSTTQPGTGPNTGEGTSTTPNNNGAGTHQPSNTQANGTENELSRTGVAVTGVAGIMMLLALAGISLNLWKVRR